MSEHRAPSPPIASIRLDKLLFYLRFVSNRAFAQQWVQAGHIRLNGQRATKVAQAISAGDVLTLPMRTHVRVITLLAIPHRRGPAAEAAACYQELSGHAATDSQESTAS